ncbi:MAG TPA: maleylpyruvate isomerase family mycothiol-dependent enzyme [Acidimicrobiales bacterium]|nr:maleylpyruvate isomerase family mycothiol-dependent enzyme [Acidimicrobiales bacterium]
MDALDIIRREGDAFYAVASTADPTRRVPSCPEWDIADLVWHLAEVHRFWAEVVERQLQDPDEAEAGAPERPGDLEGLVAMGRGNLDRLLTALAGADDDTPVWTWASQRDVGFIRRHQVQEAFIHRWDLQQAAGVDPDPIDPEAAADAIDELLAMTLPWGVDAGRPLPGSVHLHCTDTTGEWVIHADGRVEAIHAKGDVAVRGTASDLVLALYGRVDLSAVDVFGDEAVAAELLRRLDMS